MKNKNYNKYKKRYTKDAYTSIIQLVLLTILMGIIGVILKNEILILLTIVLIILILAISLNIILNKHKKISTKKIDYLSGEQFENILKHYFEKDGYKVSLTPKSHDYGADLLLEKNNKITVVQAKRYQNKVGIKAVQEVIAAKLYFDADQAIVATNSYFSKPAWDLAKETNTLLFDRNKLYEMINKQNER